MSIFTREFSVKRHFKEPIDLYLIKKNDNLMCYQVSDSELHMVQLMKTADLTAVPDYCRLANKHKFDQSSIEVRLADDLALVDNDVCNLCEPPAVLSMMN